MLCASTSGAATCRARTAARPGWACDRNLTLSEMEQRFLETLLTAGTPQHDALRQHLGGRHLQGQDGGAAGLGLADVVHVVLKLGLERLEAEAAERRYHDEASTRTEADRARTAALRRRLAIGTARTDG